MLWTLLRVLILAGFTGLLAALVVRVQLSPRTGVQTRVPSSLPTQVALSGWQFQGSQPLSPPPEEAAQWVAGRRYQYQYQNQPLTFEMNYFKDTGIADVRIWLNHNKTSSIDLDIRQHPTVGYYGLSADQRYAYLTTCIPPRGPGVVTAIQFQQNLYKANTQLNDLIGWLTGRSAPLLDDRCLWAYLFTPRTKTDEDAYIVLENAWVPWFQWWSQHYPQPVSPTGNRS
jgi:cyanosortase A-associated protein